MRKTPSYLKGLAETQARAAGAVQRIKKLISEVDRNLSRQSWWFDERRPENSGQLADDR